jgi:hypothetical protein
MNVFMKMLIFFANMRGESNSNIEALKEKNEISNCQNKHSNTSGSQMINKPLGFLKPNSSNFPSHALKRK